MAGRGAGQRPSREPGRQGLSPVPSRQRHGMDSGEPPCGLLFAAAHLGNPGENPLGIASVFLIGVIFATTIWLTGNLWLSVGIHAGVVLAEDLIFSVPGSGAVYSGHLLVSRLTRPAWLSGGDAGPEGSVLALPVFAVMLVLLWIVYRRRPPGASHLAVRGNQYL